MLRHGGREGRFDWPIQMDYITSGRDGDAREAPRRSEINANMRIRSLETGAVVIALLGTTALLASCSSDPPPDPAGAAAPLGFVPDRKPAPPVRWSDATVEKGTELEVTLSASLGSATSRRGDRFEARVARAHLQENRVIIPEGSVVNGIVNEAESASGVVGNHGGMLLLRFDHIVTPTGAGAAIEASVTRVSSGGALASVPRGRIIVGGAKGREAILKEGTPITIVLEEPLVIKVRI